MREGGGRWAVGQGGLAGLLTCMVGDSSRGDAGEMQVRGGGEYWIGLILCGIAGYCGCYLFVGARGKGASALEKICC